MVNMMFKHWCYRCYRDTIHAWKDYLSICQCCLKTTYQGRPYGSAKLRKEFDDYMRKKCASK